MSSVDQSGTATATAEQGAHESHSHGKDKGEDRVHTNVRLSDHIDISEPVQITAADTALKIKGTMAVGVKMKVSLPVDKSRGGLPSPSSKTQLGKMPRISSTGSLIGVEKAGDEVPKKRKLAVEHVTSPDNSTMGNDENVSAPPCLVALHPGIQIVSVAAGGRHTLALSDTGQVWGWGYGGEGQLGLGSRIRSVSSPHLIPSIEASFMYQEDMHANSSKGIEPDGALLPKVPGNYVKAVACGGRHSAIVTDAGALLTFGWGLHGQCGQGSTEDEVSPCYVSKLGGLLVKEVAAGLWHTVCITESGDVYSFGGNQFGQLGTGGDLAEVFPRLVEAPLLESQHAVSVSCGARHSAISTVTGKIFCWGWNKYGQLGLGDNLDRNVPAEVPLECSFAAAVACGWWHTLCLIHCR